LVCCRGRKIGKSPDDPLVREVKPLRHVRPTRLGRPSSCQIDNQDSLSVGLSLTVIDGDMQSACRLRKSELKP
jgi:hypothetical protein